MRDEDRLRSGLAQLAGLLLALLLHLALWCCVALLSSTRTDSAAIVKPLTVQVSVASVKPTAPATKATPHKRTLSRESRRVEMPTRSSTESPTTTTPSLQPTAIPQTTTEPPHEATAVDDGPPKESSPSSRVALAPIRIPGALVNMGLFPRQYRVVLQGSASGYAIASFHPLGKRLPYVDNVLKKRLAEAIAADPATMRRAILAPGEVDSASSIELTMEFRE